MPRLRRTTYRDLHGLEERVLRMKSDHEKNATLPSSWAGIIHLRFLCYVCNCQGPYYCTLVSLFIGPGFTAGFFSLIKAMCNIPHASGHMCISELVPGMGAINIGGQPLALPGAGCDLFVKV